MRDTLSEAGIGRLNTTSGCS